MSTIVVVHGAWSGSWAWRKVRLLLQRRGHEVITTTLTGLGDRAHLLTPEVGLEFHIADVVATLEYEDLTDVVLLAHSYGGMVATAVANRLPDRIAQLVYLDAFVPTDGQSMIDLLPPSAAEETRQRAAEAGDGWQLPPNPLAPDTPGELREWMAKRRMPQTLLTQSQPISLRPGVATPRRSYIYCTRIGPHDIFGPFAAQAKADPAWRYFEIDSTHGPHITAPDALTDLIDRIAAGA